MMKKIAYRVDSNFSRYIDNSGVGHLPDLGISGYTVARSEVMDFETYTALDDGMLNTFEALLFAKPAYHHLSNVAIAFWPKMACWRCKGRFSAHSFVAKKVSMYEDIDVAVGIGPRGRERVGVCKPQLLYSGVGAPLAFMPYGCEALDRVLVGVWKTVSTDPQLTALLDSKPAELNYQESHNYGGSYWANICPHCSALSGEHFLKRSSRADTEKPCAGEPQLLVLPKINGEDTLGGKVVARLSWVRI